MERSEMLSMGMQESNTKYIQNEFMESERILQTPSLLAREALFYIQEIGWMQCKKMHQNPRDSLDSYLLVLVKEGIGVFTVGEEKFTVKKGDVIFLDCHQPYSHCSSSKKPWSIAWVHWNSKTMPQLYEVFRHRNKTVVISDAAEVFQPYYENLEAIVKDDAPDHELFESECLVQIITLLLTIRATERVNVGGDGVQKWEQIHQYLEKHFAEKVTLEELSQKFQVSKYYMLRGFKKKYGVTIIQYINQCRMNYAKELLRFTEKQIDEIAISCGIHDSSYFNRIFRATEGISAGAYRKQWRN